MTRNTTIALLVLATLLIAGGVALGRAVTDLGDQLATRNAAALSGQPVHASRCEP